MVSSRVSGTTGSVTNFDRKPIRYLVSCTPAINIMLKSQQLLSGYRVFYPFVCSHVKHMEELTVKHILAAIPEHCGEDLLRITTVSDITESNKPKTVKVRIKGNSVCDQVFTTHGTDRIWRKLSLYRTSRRTNWELCLQATWKSCA